MSRESGLVSFRVASFELYAVPAEVDDFDRRLHVVNPQRVLQCGMWLPGSIESVFGFFGAAENLESITPEFLHFEILTPPPILMRVGTLIDYRIRIRGIPVKWRTRITAWDPPYRFVDEQIKGPYALWVHEHTFEPSGSGTWCTDRVEYSVTGGELLGGKVVEPLLVRPDLLRIFGYRQWVLDRIFKVTEVARGDRLAAVPPTVRTWEPERVTLAGQTNHAAQGSAQDE